MQLATILGYIAGGLAIVGGLFGTVFPALPGLPLMLAGMGLIGYLEDFQHLGMITFTILIILTIIGSAIDFLAGLFGAKATGASKQALWGAFIGGIVGIFFGIPGAVLGPLVGAVIGELCADPNAKKAGKVGLGTFIGFLVGTCAKISCAFAMLATFALAFVF